MSFVSTAFVMAMLLHSSPADEAADLTNAIQLLQQGDDAKSEALFLKVVASDPESATAYCDLGVIYLRENKLTEAIDSLQKAHQLTPQVAGIEANLGLAYYRAEQFTSAIQYLSGALQLKPGLRDPQYLLGLSNFRLNHYAQTVEALQPLFQDENSNPFYLFALTISYGKLGLKADAERTFNAFQAVSADTATYHMLRGRIYLDLGENKPAATEFVQSALISPTCPYIHLLLGTAYRREGMIDQAESEYRIEIDQMPKEALSYRDLGELYLQDGSLENAVDMLQSAVKLQPDLDDVLVDIGKAYFQLGDFALAQNYLNSAIKRSPDSVEAHYLLSRVLQRQGMPEESDRETAMVKRLIKTGDTFNSNRDDLLALPIEGPAIAQNR